MGLENEVVGLDLEVVGLKNAPNFKSYHFQGLEIKSYHFQIKSHHFQSLEIKSYHFQSKCHHFLESRASKSSSTTSGAW